MGLLIKKGVILDTAYMLELKSQMFVFEPEVSWYFPENLSGNFPAAPMKYR